MSRARSLARTRVLQALYQWQMAAQDLSAIESQFLEEQDMSKVDIEYFQELLHAIPKGCSGLDSHADSAIDRPVSQLDPIEHAVLWIAIYEMENHPEIPYRVIINEAVELAKRFGAEQSHRFINGVLDKLAKGLREAEVKARS